MSHSPNIEGDPWQLRPCQCCSHARAVGLVFLCGRSFEACVACSGYLRRCENQIAKRRPRRSRVPAEKDVLIMEPVLINEAGT